MACILDSDCLINRVRSVGFGYLESLTSGFRIVRQLVRIVSEIRSFRCTIVPRSSS